FDGGVEGSEDGSGQGRAADAGHGLGAGENRAYLTAGMSEGACDLADRHPVTARQANRGVAVHRRHPCLRSRAPVGDVACWNGFGWDETIFVADPGPRSVVISHRLPAVKRRCHLGRKGRTMPSPDTGECKWATGVTRKAVFDFTAHFCSNAPEG